MKTFEQRRARSVQAFNFIELIVILGIIVFVVAILAPSLARTRNRPPGMQCVKNLKNIGLAFRIYATDNNDRFPTYPLQTNLNTAFLNSKPMDYYWDIFRSLSNELSTGAILVCPQDSRTKEAENWEMLSSANISYFVGLDATEQRPSSILSGDRNLVMDGVNVENRVIGLSTNSGIGWNEEMHEHKGFIGLGDGSVQQANSNRFGEQLTQAATNEHPITWLAVP